MEIVYSKVIYIGLYLTIVILSFFSYLIISLHLLFNLTGVHVVMTFCFHFVSIKVINFLGTILLINVQG